MGDQQKGTAPIHQTGDSSFCEQQYTVIVDYPNSKTPQGIISNNVQHKTAAIPHSSPSLPRCTQCLVGVFIAIHVMATVLLLVSECTAGSAGSSENEHGDIVAGGETVSMGILLLADIMIVMAWILFGIREFELAQKVLHGATLVLFLVVTLIICNIIKHLASIIYCEDVKLP